MSQIENAIKMWEFSRDRTLATLETIAEMDDPDAVLMWRPAPGRAYIGWQLMHVAVTEEIFAHLRLIEGTPAFPELIKRFQKESVPDDQPVTLELLRETFQTARQNLLKTIRTFEGTDLSVIPEPLQERGWSVEFVLSVVAWHEAHHQGQAHLTLNLFKQQAS